MHGPQCHGHHGQAKQAAARETAFVSLAAAVEDEPRMRTEGQAVVA